MIFRISLICLLIYSCRFGSTQSIVNTRFTDQQECQTPSGSEGVCIRAQHCPMPELKQKYSNFLDYLCIIIEQSVIGVCCPKDLSANNDISGVLFPQRGDEVPLVRQVNNFDTGKSNLAPPAERGCGLSTRSYSKIVGGRPADPNEWPWMVAILRRGYHRVFCGGVLITNQHTLTAAHCIYKYNKNDITVRLGEYNFQKTNETRARDFRITDIRQHIDFDETTFDNDICLLKMHQPVLFNSYIWPVCMPPTPADTFESYIGIVIGWGSQFFGGPNSDTLMEVSVPIWNHEDCQNVFIEHIGKRVLCAGGEERDSCQGDSGGPLLVQLSNKRWIVVGIVSYGIRCGEKNRPGIYTRVSEYSSWIIENAIF